VKAAARDSLAAAFLVETQLRHSLGKNIRLSRNWWPRLRTRYGEERLARAYCGLRDGQDQPLTSCVALLEGVVRPRRGLGGLGLTLGDLGGAEFGEELIEVHGFAAGEGEEGLAADGVGFEFFD